MTFTPIGTVHNSITDPALEISKDENWGAVLSEIRLRPDLAPGLTGLQDFSHAVIVFWMHEASFDPAKNLVRRARDRADMPLAGIFAQRARHRPNPIGITTVAIDRIEGASLFVRGLDAMNGTPVLDIKPHVPTFDSGPDARVAEWMERLMVGYF